jgi:negative regulator of sigma E activity
MNQSDIQREEQLSSLLDSALEGDRLTAFMQDLKRDPVKDAETAKRYRLMGDVMRDELDQASFMDISSAVSRAIEQEPAHSVSDMAVQKVKTTSAINVSTVFNRWFKPVAGVSVAASVAVVTLLTFNAVNKPSTSAAVQLAQSTGVEPVQRVSLPLVNPEIARNIRVASTIEVSKSPQQQKQLNIYMLQHSGYASQSTMQGIMPYVRAADVKAREQD